MNILSLLAFFAGAAIAIQAALNANLSHQISSALLATCIAFICSFVCISIITITFTRNYPSLDTIASVPKYLWLSGGVLSAVGVSLFYFLIPKMGIAAMMSIALCGQLMTASFIGHFGFFEQPAKPFDVTKFVGLIALITGILLINRE